MANEDDQSPEEQFQDFMRQLFGEGGIDPAQMQQLSGLGLTPEMMQQMMRQMQSAFTTGESGISWDDATRQALHIANQSDLGVDAGARADLDQAFTLAALWLSEATAIAELAEPGHAITRGAWVEATMPVWRELAEPAALSIAEAITNALADQVPEDMQGMLQGASRMLRGVGGSMIAAQLGQVVGRLSKEVVSGGDVGIPLMPAGSAAILPQNFADFGAGLEIPEDQLALAVAVRELAHARLFRHAKWLRLDVIAQVTDFARGTKFDTSAIEDLAERIDLQNPQELQSLLESGALMPPRTEQQELALTRLENVLALIEGWVDVVTTDATSRLPSADKVAEVVRRRRAVGGPAEKALGSLVGLELRPRRMREAAAMWRAVTDAVGIQARDALWDYPDLMPTAEDIDDPSKLIATLGARARGEEPVRDEFDEALAQLLDEEARGDKGDSGAGDSGDKGEDENPAGPTPV